MDISFSKVAYADRSSDSLTVAWDTSKQAAWDLRLQWIQVLVTLGCPVPRSAAAPLSAELGDKYRKQDVKNATVVRTMTERAQHLT